MFYSDTFPQIIQSLWLSRGKMLSGFAIGHPGQRRVPLLVTYKIHQRNNRIYKHFLNSSTLTLLGRIRLLSVTCIIDSGANHNVVFIYGIAYICDRNRRIKNLLKSLHHPTSIFPMVQSHLY
jgi:hypothetical protein